MLEGPASSGLHHFKGHFQKKLKANFLNEPGITESEADMVVFGKTDWEQDGNLLNSLEPRGTTPTSSKSSTILQADTWKKGLESVLQPNSTLVMRASTRSEKEVVPLQISTLVTLTLETSTGSEKTHQDLETRKYPTLKLLGHYISIGCPCDQRQLPQDQDPYWNFKKGLYVKDGSKTRVPDLWLVSSYQIFDCEAVWMPNA